MDVDLLLADPQYLRAELVGPLGIKLSLAQINERWGSVYWPREKILRRIPLDELQKNSLRRERFLRSIGLPILPDVLAESALSRVGFVGSNKLPGQCNWDPELRAYWFSWELRKRLVWVHPQNFTPLRVEFYDGRFPGAPVAERRPAWVIRYQDFRGEGPSTLPFLLTAEYAKEAAFTLQWKSVESTKDFNPSLFDWTPKGEFKIEEY